jgi:hypothetical protein
MNIPIRNCVFAVTTLSVIFQISLPNPSVRPVTVCEVLANLDTYRGKTVAVVGRLGGTDEGVWLAQDNCDHELQSNGFIWPNMLWITTNSHAPSPAEGSRLIDKKVLEEKVLQLAAGTKLRPIPAHDEYAVLYGRLDASEKLETFTYPNGTVRGFGYGHLDAAPAQLVFNDTVISSLFGKQIRTMLRKRREARPPNKTLQPPSRARR